MEGILIFVVVVGGLALLDIAAWKFGVDSRPGFEDPRAPAHDLSV